MTTKNGMVSIVDERLINLRQLQAEAKRFADERQMRLFSKRDLESLLIEGSAIAQE